jgi:RNA polymerase sigma factor (sigma-70 family)
MVKRYDSQTLPPRGHSLSSQAGLSATIIELEDVVSEPSLPEQSALTREQFESLIIEHIDFARRISWKLLNRWRITLCEDEVQSISAAALCEAASRFDLKRGVSFRTFLFYHLRGALLKEIARAVNDAKAVALDLVPADQMERAPSRDVIEFAVVCQNPTPEEQLIASQLSSLCRKACAELDALERDVLFRHFGLEQSVVQIAKELGYCRCHISRIKTQVLDRLQRTIHQRCEKVVEPRSLPNEDAMRSRYTGGRGRRKRATLRHAA